MTNQQMDENALLEIAAILRQHGEAATRERSPEEAAREWLDAGFDDADEVSDWLQARCFTAAGAQLLERAGLTPEQASIRTRAGSVDYEDTLGFKITSGDLSLEEARRIITSNFWNS